MDIVVTIALLIYIGIREYFFFKERKDLIDRLMAKTFIEYKDNTEIKEEKVKVKPETEVDLEEAKEEIQEVDNG